MKKMSQLLANYAILIVLTLVLQTTHSTSSNHTGFTMRMIPIDSPESPLYPGNLTELQRIERLVEFSNARVRYLDASISSNVSVVEPEGAAIMAVYQMISVYSVTLFLGNPPTQVYLIMDTGSSVTWTQCLPCIQCYPQSVPIYSSSASRAFVKLPCSSPLCSGPRAPFRCVANECQFGMRYQSGQTTEGEVGTDTVSYIDIDGSIKTRRGVIFGCARITGGFSSFENTVVGGIMGLSFAPESIVTSLGDRANRRFSYCLIPIISGGGSHSLLTFGDAIQNPPGNAFVTPLVPHPDPRVYHFYVELHDISVGSRRLGFSPGTFAFSGDAGGFVVDSGSSLTYLSDFPYEVVLAEFQVHYDSLQLERTSISSLDLCYRYPNGFSDFMSMTFHFAGADFFIDGRSVGLHGSNNGNGYFCIALLRGGQRNILGAAHQANTRFTFDGNTNTLQFYRDVCP